MNNKDKMTNYRVAVIAVIVEDKTSTDPLNALLHEYGKYIVGRMGIPYRNERGGDNIDVGIISVAIDAPQQITSALSGKIGRLPGVTTRTVYSNVYSGRGENGKEDH